MKSAKTYFPWLYLIILFVFFFILAVLSTGTYGGADDLAHYRIAKYAWLYPHLFLDHWGKPLFTILSAPFAWFGFLGIKTFNILVGVLTAFFTYKTAKILSLKNAWMVLLFVVFAPIYSIMMLTGMTEILFSFVLILGVYLFFAEKPVFAALVISFLPLARTEGIVIWLIFLIVLLYNRKWKSIPFLLSGFLLFSFIGYFFYYHDFLWLIHQMPYSNQASVIYGHGELLHFVMATPKTIGILLGVLSLIGLGIFFVRFFKREKWFRADQAMNELLMIFGSFFAYFAAHSYVWWKGIGASLGLIRVMVGIIPLWVIFSLQGYNQLERWIGSRFRRWLLSGILLILIATPFFTYQIPVHLSYKEKVIKRAANWFRQSPYFENKIYFYDHFFWFFWGLNPFDTARIQERVQDPTHPAKGVPINSIVIWDAHFAPNEGRLPLDNMLTNSGYELLNVIYPEQPFKVLGGYDYGIYFFKRIADSVTVDNYKIRENLEKNRFRFDHADTLVKRNFTDSLIRASNPDDSATTVSGFIPPTDQQYFFTKKIATDRFKGELFEVKVNLTLNAEPPLPGKLFLVISTGKNGQIIDYDAYDLLSGKDRVQATEQEIVKRIADYPNNSETKIYIWQKVPVKICIESYSVIVRY